jgi:hypothetical protein
MYRADLPPGASVAVQFDTTHLDEAQCVFSLVDPATNRSTGPFPCNALYKNGNTNTMRVYVSISGSPDIQGQKYTLITYW